MGSGRCEEWVVDVAVRAAGIERRRVDRCEGGIPAQALHDVGIRQGETPQWRNVGESCVDVVRNPVPRAAIAHHQDGSWPSVTERAEEFVISHVMHVQVCQPERGKCGDEMTVLRPYAFGVSLVDTAQRHRRRDTDADAIRPDFVGDGLRHLYDEA